MNELFWWISCEGMLAMQGRFRMDSESMRQEFMQQHVTGQVNKTDEDASLLQVQNGIALIPITGMITYAADPWMSYFGEESANVINIKAQLREALARDDVFGIMLMVNSPGGHVTGIDELASFIYNSVRGVKPIYTQVTGHCASAAYYIGCQTNMMFCNNRTNGVGSIGTLFLVDDYSESYKKSGVRAIPVATGFMKTLNVPGVPVTDEMIVRVKMKAETLNGYFKESVLRSRNIDAEDFEMITSTADVFLAEEAVNLNLIDGIQTPEITMSRLIQSVANTASLGTFSNII